MVCGGNPESNFQELIQAYEIPEDWDNTIKFVDLVSQ